MSVLETLLAAAGSGGVASLGTWLTVRRRGAASDRRAEATERVASLKHDGTIAPLLIERIETVEAEQRRVAGELEKCEEGRAEDREECAKRDAQTRAEHEAKISATLEIVRDLTVEVRRAAKRADEDTAVQRLDKIATRASRSSRPSMPTIQELPRPSKREPTR